MYKTKEEVENWLRKMKIKKYVISKDLTVDVHEDVNISYKNLKEIPIKFNIIEGSFTCSGNELTSLKGCPEKINGFFDCSYNELFTLEYCVKEINGDFSCMNNYLSNLEFSPQILKGNFVRNQ